MPSKQNVMLIATLCVLGSMGYRYLTEEKRAAEKARAVQLPIARSEGRSGLLDEEIVRTLSAPMMVSASNSRLSEGHDSAAEITAFTEPYRDISVACPEMGTISVVRAHEGDIVQAGDVIALMEDSVLQASLQIGRMSMGVQGTLNSALADFDMKKSGLEKLTQLRDRHHASQQELDRVKTEFRIAEARVQTVREELRIKQLEFHRIEAQLEQRVIRAPINGEVTEVSREVGEFVSPSDPMVARVVQLDPLLIVFSVPITQRSSVAENETVALEIGSDRQSAEGVVEYVSPTADSSNSSVRVKVRLPNPDSRFESGDTAVLVLQDGAPAHVPTEKETTPVAQREP